MSLGYRWIFHCIYCQRQWIDLPNQNDWNFDSYDGEIWHLPEYDEKPKTVTRLYPNTVLTGVYYHEKVICESCLPCVPNLYILKSEDPFFQTAEKLKQDIRESHSHILNEYVTQFLSDLNSQQIREIASRSSLCGNRNHQMGVLKEKLLSAVFCGLMKSKIIWNWTDEIQKKLDSLEQDKLYLLGFSLYEPLLETTFNRIALYHDCQQAPHIACGSVKKAYHELEHIPRTAVYSLAKKYMKDMPAFLRSRGIDPDTLFEQADT